MKVDVIGLSSSDGVIEVRPIIEADRGRSSSNSVRRQHPVWPAGLIPAPRL